MDIDQSLKAGQASTTRALAICDALAPVDLDFMYGSWRGYGFYTDHPMDGLLEAFHWYGKRFDDADHVHPLIFTTRRNGLAALNPAFMGPALKLTPHLPRSAIAGRVFQFALPLFTTSHSRARLRLTTYRGLSSATMIYDQLPINDVFRRIDDNTVFGIMDFKAMQKPFFFILRRELDESQAGRDRNKHRC